MGTARDSRGETELAAEVSGGWDGDGRAARARAWVFDTWQNYQWAIAFWFCVFVAFRIFVPVPVAILAVGVVVGSLSAMVAMGLVLIYRANRIINFAQAQVGGVAAAMTASLIVGPKWAFLPAAAVGLVTAIVLGAITEFVFIRRFAKAPRLLLTVATIGIMQLFAFFQLGLPRLFHFDTAPQPPQPFNFHINWHPVVFRGGHVLVVLVVPLVAVGLGLFFRATRVGIAVRASAESADRAALLGIPVKRLGTLVWTMSAALSGLGVLLRLPIQGVNVGGIEGTALLMRALAAAVIARMESLPKAFAAALGLGMFEQAVLYHTGRTVLVDGFLFFIVIAGLLFQRRGGQSRADDLGASSWAATREVRPIPRELSFLPEVRASQVVLGIVMFLGLVVVPLHLSPGRVNLMGVGLMFAMVTLSLVILTGWAGQISLGQVAFMAFGSAVGGSLALANWNFFLCLMGAGLVGALIAVLVGLPALRIKGLFLAVSTLAFALATGTYFLNNEFFTWLVPDPNKRVVRPVIFDKFDLEKEHTFYFVILIFFLFTLASVRSLRRSRTGRILVATRDNQRAAQSYAINPIRAKLSAFALSGFFAALAGGLYVFHQHGISSTVLDPDSSVRVFSMAVVGGLGSIPGALLGAVYMTVVDYSSFTREPLSRFLASGVGVLIILMFMPAGLGSLIYSVRDNVLRFIARRRDIVVPSLLADVRVEEETNILDEEADLENLPTQQIEHLSMPKDPLLLVRDLDAGYGKTQVLFGVDMHVERGEMVALLGTNGAGKSTLLSVISGLLEPSKGTVTFDGVEIAGDTPQETLAKGVVFMPGGKGVFPTLTVEENFKLAGWQFAKDQEYLDGMYSQCFEYFPVLKDRWDQKAGNLSGGEQQMVTLSQALIAKPRLLMIDELSLGLAPLIVEQLLGIVRAIHANGTTVVLVEQSVNVAITLAQRAIFMEKGEVRFDGPTHDLLERPDILRAVFLQGADAGRGADVPKVAASARKPFIDVCHHCGHEHHEVLAVSGIGVSFGGVRAVNGVDLAVRASEVVGIIGPNGSGKTTLFDLMSGFVVPTEGRVDLLGEDVTAWTPDMRAERGLGRSFQDARLFPSMTVRQTISTALERHLEIRDPFAAAVLSPAVRIAERGLSQQVDALIETMHLQAFADKFVGELSTGTRRVVDIACSLAHEPSVLLLDEPSSGIAQREAEALAPLLLNIRDQTQAALIVIEHDMPLIRGISDRLVALELGEVVAEGDPDAVIHDPRVVEGYLGGTIEVIERSGGGGKPKPAPKTKKVAAAKKSTNGNGNGNGAAKKPPVKRAAARKKIGV
ncbi:MAG: hypothetical protein QOG90_1441 [Actinomycetota bacterium]